MCIRPFTLQMESGNGSSAAWEFHNYNSGAAGIRPYYEIPNRRIEFHPTRSPLRQGSYRALAATANHFARESFIDERAHLVKVDPLKMDKGDLIGQALVGRPAGATVLLSHTPWKADAAASAGASLMLSGHTHAVQVWPFGYLVRLRYPLLEGRYEVNGMPIIVSRGTGTWGPRMRLWRPNEILRITLRSS